MTTTTRSNNSPTPKTLRAQRLLALADSHQRLVARFQYLGAAAPGCMEAAGRAAETRAYHQQAADDIRAAAQELAR